MILKLFVGCGGWTQQLPNESSRSRFIFIFVHLKEFQNIQNSRTDTTFVE